MPPYRTNEGIGKNNPFTSSPSGQKRVGFSLPDTTINLKRNRLLVDIYHTSWPRLCAYLRKTFGAGPPDPEDVAQTAFCKFAALEDPHAIKNPHAFLITTARNIVFDHYKKAKTRHTHLQNITDDLSAGHNAFDDLTPERVILGKEECNILRHTLKSMSEKRRELLILHRIHGMSYVELSQHTGLSQTTVKYHVAMAFSECLTAMKEAGLTSDSED